jgi:hypothetical protein
MVTTARKPARPVVILVSTRPHRYSLILRGDAKKLIKFCVQMSSRKAINIPCWILLITPTKGWLEDYRDKSEGLLSKSADVFCDETHWMMSITSHKKTVARRVGLLLSRNICLM